MCVRVRVFLHLRVGFILPISASGSPSPSITLYYVLCAILIHDGVIRL